MDPPVKPEGERWETGWRPACLTSLLLCFPYGLTGGSPFNRLAFAAAADLDCPVDPPVEPEEDNGGQR
jgi:hypothetical protein